MDAPTVFVESRSKPLEKVPPMRFGSMPRDGGGFILNDEERAELIANEPLAENGYIPILEPMNSLTENRGGVYGW